MRASVRRSLSYVLVAVLAFTVGSAHIASAAPGGLTALEARVTAAEGAIVTISASLSSNVASLTQAIADALTAAKAYTDQQVGSEAAARQAADAALQANITAEASARQAGDAGLQTAINNEAAARQAADSTLQTNINNEISARQAAVGAEAVARQSADNALQTSISNEATARQNADTTLQTNINNEASARASGDASTLAAANVYTDSKIGALGMPTIMWAQLKGDGTIMDGVSRGVVSTAREDVGAYKVKFVRSVFGCMVLTSLRFNGAGETMSFNHPNPTIVDTVFVRVFNSSGPVGFPPAARDNPVTVLVMC